MKKQNIVFSGFMAAILFSAGAANAATQIASKQYVDNRETSILQTVSNTYETKENVTNLTEQVTQLGDTINNEDTGLAAKVDDAAAAAAEAKQTADTAQSTATGAQRAVEALGATVGNAESGLVKDVNDLETSVGGLQTTVSGLDKELDSKLDSATAATTYEKVSNRTPELTADTSATMYPTVGAVRNYVQTEVSSLSSLPVDPGKMNDNSLEGSKLKDGAVSTDKIANGAVTGDKIGADAVNGDKIADDSIGAEHIKDGAVGSDAIADGSVTGTDIADGTISADNLDTALNAEIDGKEDKSNKATVIDTSNQASTDAYPSVKAVYDWTTQQIANVEFDPSTDLGTGSVSGDKITDGTITGDKIADDAIDSDAIADNAVGTGQIADGAVTGDKIADSAVDSAAIADGTVTEADLNTDLASKINGKQDKNVGAGNSGKILTVGVDGNITTSATIAQARVDGLTDALADKVDDSELTTINQTIEQIEQNVTNITAPDSGLLAKKEDSANKKNSITPDIESSDTYFPTIGAMTSWVSSEISDLSELPVNPGLIEDGTLAGSKLQNGAITSEKIAASAVTTEKIANDAVTEDKLSNDVVAKIDGKADLSAVYTRQQTNDKIVEIAIQQPQNTCTSESDLCVLTLTRDNKLAWVPVTDPATAPVDAGPIMGSQNTDTSVD